MSTDMETAKFARLWLRNLRPNGRSAAYRQHWEKLMNAQRDFMQAQPGKDTSEASQTRFVVRYNALAELVLAEPPPFDDYRERQLFELFIQQRALPFLEYWENVFDAADERGFTVILPKEIPPWVDADELP